MTREWEQEFRERMLVFSALRPVGENEVPLSIKVGVASGCFHAEHSPQAYRLINQHLEALRPDSGEFVFQPHESGPELLVYAALGTAGITLAKSVVDLVTTVVKARAEGIRRGDDRRDPLLLKVRRTRRDGRFEEEIAVELDWHDAVTREEVEAALSAAVDRLLQDDLGRHS